MAYHRQHKGESTEQCSNSCDFSNRAEGVGDGSCSR